MFGIGEAELVVIAIILIIVVKPEDVPIVFKKVGEGYRKCQRLYHAFLDEINKNM